MAGVTPIGMATSEGDIQVGRVRMPGPATLYEGAVVETGNSPARLSFRNGSVVQLGGGAKATIHGNLLLLERGTGQLETSGDYAIRARSVTVVAASHPARARLQLSGDGALQIAALSGTIEVRRAGASAIVAAGKSLQLSPAMADVGAVAASEFKGCLAKSDKGYFLQIENTKSVVALRAESIGAKSGDRITVTGRIYVSAPPVAGASQVVQVLRLVVNGHGCSSKAVLALASGGGAAAASGAGAAVAGAASAGAAAAGLSATTITVIGVAAASAALIPTVALTSGSSSSSGISPSSR